MGRDVVRLDPDSFFEGSLRYAIVSGLGMQVSQFDVGRRLTRLCLDGLLVSGQGQVSLSLGCIAIAQRCTRSPEARSARPHARIAQSLRRTGRAAGSSCPS